MPRFKEDFYEEDKNYQVKMFVGEIMVPFKATYTDLQRIYKLHSRPKWLRPRNFGVTSDDGSLMLKVDLTKVLVIEAKETVASMWSADPEAKETSEDSTDGNQRTDP